MRVNRSHILAIGHRVEAIICRLIWCTPASTLKHVERGNQLMVHHHEVCTINAMQLHSK